MKGYYNNKKGIGIIFDDIFFVNGKRTPFGKYCGTLSKVSPTDLGIFASRATLEKCKIKGEEINQFIAANIGQSSTDAYFLPRHIALYSGVPVEVPALMVQRICASGFETIITASEQITLGKAQTVLCCGTENMSLSPTVSFGNRMGYPLGKAIFQDMLWEALNDTAAGYPMGYTAENVAKKYKISRQNADEFALCSFERTLKARKKGFFDKEIEPFKSVVFEREGLKSRKVEISPKLEPFALDENVRETSLEALSKLPPVFDKNGVQTAGNSSGIVDGAAAAIITNKASVISKKLKPLAKIVAATSSGVDPKYMGLGPVPAIKLLLEITGLNMDDIGLIEINEAFAAQIIGCERELNIDRKKLNINGGAIAIGHPLAATGIRLTLTLARAMKQHNVKYGIASACIGGGQGTAILLENINYKK